MEFSDDHKPASRRETMLTIMLTALAGGGFLLFLILVSGGFFFYVFLAVGAITALGFFHYMIWGYAMTQEVTEEQAREEEVKKIFGEGESLGSHQQPRRF